MDNLLGDLVNDKRFLSEFFFANFDNSVLTKPVTLPNASAIPAEFGLLINPSGPLGEWTLNCELEHILEKASKPPQPKKMKVLDTLPAKDRFGSSAVSLRMQVLLILFSTC